MDINKAYDQWSSQYDTNPNKTRDLDKEATVNVLKDLDFKSVLELGCGTGKNTKWFAGKASSVTAVDFSEEMLALAKTKINSEKVVFHSADIIKDWNFISHQPDLITCNLVLEHVENLYQIFEKAYKNLQSGGHFFISELHPFKQYKGTKARFETTSGTIELQTFTHHISEFLDSAKEAGFSFVRLNEWFDKEENTPPRLISFLFKKE